MNKRSLIAGAGKAEIMMPAGFFPTLENFVASNDPVFARAVYLEKGGRILIISLELTSLMAEYLDEFRETAADEAGLKKNEVWFTVTHSFSTPHLYPRKRRGHMEECYKEGQDLFEKALKDACRKAVREAMDSRGPSRIGYGSGVSFVNINRDVMTKDGWWTGRNEEGFSDRNVKAIKIEGNDGTPVAVLYNYGVGSSVSQNAELPGGGYLVSGDLAGAASGYVENEFHVPAIFLLGASGDQSPVLSACYNDIDINGEIRKQKLGEEGYFLAGQLGSLLGSAVTDIAADILCDDLPADLISFSDSVICDAKFSPRGQDLVPVKQYDFVADGEKEATIDILSLGDMALVGTQAEVTAATSAFITDESPFKFTMVCSMVNGEAKYMARREAYRNFTYESMNSPFMAGSAEKWENRVIEDLNKFRDPDMRRSD